MKSKIKAIVRFFCGKMLRKLADLSLRLDNAPHLREQVVQWNVLNDFVLPNLKWADKNYSLGNPGTIESNSVISNKTIWMYWAQGVDQAPPLVIKCIESVRRNKGDYNLIILTKEDLSKYVIFPDFILEKYSNGIIPQAQFSDLLRINLLSIYGGVWVDATCFLTDQISEKYTNEEFFCFQRSNLYTDASHGSNWFLIGKQNNIVCKKLMNFLFEYWRTNDTLVHYYLFHIVLYGLANNNKECIEVFDKMTYFCNAQPHIMLFSLNKPYSDNLMNHIKSCCFVQKLTYKYDKSLEIASEENVLQHFLKS